VAVSPPRYALDADVFIAAARRYYAFDLVPGFWRELINQARRGRVISVDRVRVDLERGKDQLAQWAKDEFSGWFDSAAQPDVLAAYARVMAWAKAQGQFTAAAKAEFANVSDGWLVAYALAKGCVVVTNEVVNPYIKRRIPIPNACDAFAVPYRDTFAMLRDLGVSWA